MIRAILFDMDGVLVDFADAHYRALNEALQAVCGRQIGPEERSRYEGLSTRQKLRLLVDLGWLRDEDRELVYRLKQEATMLVMAEMVRPDPEKVEMCRALSRDYLLGCVSNCVRASVNGLLLMAGLDRFMAATVSNQDVAHPKPAPDPYELACRRLLVAPREALAVEDNEKGVESAAEAGCFVLTVDGCRDVTLEGIRRACADPPMEHAK